MDDIWDGRLTYWIFANAIAGEPTLPYRLQEEFATMHRRVGFTEALVTDAEDTLLSPAEQNDELLIKNCATYAISNNFVSEIFKDNKALLETLKHEPEEETNFETVFRNALKWRFHTVDERLLQTEVKTQLTTYEQKRANRQRQNLSKMYAFLVYFITNTLCV